MSSQNAKHEIAKLKREKAVLEELLRRVQRQPWKDQWHLDLIKDIEKAIGER